jgi:hypothetical protein
MPPYNAEKATEGLNRYFRRMELAREVDPDAFKPFNQRQLEAENKVIKEHPELAPSNAAD